MHKMENASSEVEGGGNLHVGTCSLLQNYFCDGTKCQAVYEIHQLWSMHPLQFI